MQNDIITITLPNPCKNKKYILENTKDRIIKVTHRFKIKYQDKTFKDIALYFKGDKIELSPNKRSWELIDFKSKLVGSFIQFPEKTRNIHIGETPYEYKN